VVRQGFGHTAINGKGTTPVSVFLAIGYQGGIFVEAVHDGFENTVAELVLFHFAERLAIGIEGETFLGSNFLDPAVF